MSHKSKRSNRRAARRPPASGRKPACGLTARDIATGVHHQREPAAAAARPLQHALRGPGNRIGGLPHPGRS